MAVELTSPLVPENVPIFVHPVCPCFCDPPSDISEFNKVLADRYGHAEDVRDAAGRKQQLVKAVWYGNQKTWWSGEREVPKYPVPPIDTELIGQRALKNIIHTPDGGVRGDFTPPLPLDESQWPRKFRKYLKKNPDGTQKYARSLVYTHIIVARPQWGIEEWVHPADVVGGWEQTRWLHTGFTRDKNNRQVPTYIDLMGPPPNFGLYEKWFSIIPNAEGPAPPPNNETLEYIAACRDGYEQDSYYNPKPGTALAVDIFNRRLERYQKGLEKRNEAEREEAKERLVQMERDRKQFPDLGINVPMWQKAG